MALITLHAVGFFDRELEETDEKYGAEIDINPDWIGATEAWTSPVGTRLTITRFDRDIVVSETKAEIRALING